MNKVFKLLLGTMALCLFPIYSVAQEDNYLYIDPVTVTAGETESELSIYLKNTETICGFECWLSLPSGIEVFKEFDEEWIWGLTRGARLKSSHVIALSEENGLYHILCYSSSNADLYESSTKKDKPVMTLTLTVPSSAKSGAYDTVLKKVVLNHNENSIITEYKPKDMSSEIMIRPASGTEKSISEGIVQIASDEETSVGKTEYKNFIESVGEENVTGVDLRATQLDENITAEDLKEGLNENAIILLPEGSEITGDNIVVDRVCENLVMTDGEAFAAPANFTATNATYTRDITNLSTICLPYTPSTDNFEYYELTEETVDALRFTKVESPKANTPYLFRKKGEDNAITGSGVEITTDGAGGKTMGTWNMVGTYETVVLTAADDAYALSGGKLYHNTGTLTISPFRAYFTNTGSSVKSMDIYLDGEYTGIQMTEEGEFVNRNADTYNMSGQKVDDNYKGVVIRNGVKTLKR